MSAESITSNVFVTILRDGDNALTEITDVTWASREDLVTQVLAHHPTASAMEPYLLHEVQNLPKEKRGKVFIGEVQPLHNFAGGPDGRLCNMVLSVDRNGQYVLFFPEQDDVVSLPE